MMSVSCQTKTQLYTIQTTMGDIKVKLYKDTPLHQKNFEQLVEEGFYDGVAFHRVINNFMIQAGDYNTKPNVDGKPDKERMLIPAEFVSTRYHKKGALAAARQGDQVNPEKMSSPTQFYIVQGTVQTPNDLDIITDFEGKTWTKDQKETYYSIGGTPFLDNDYTVFGEVVEGLEVVDAIAAVQTSKPGDRPIETVRIIKVIPSKE